ncbi:MAG TPA: hypothetical protein VHD15_06785 [Hyphomicrobiales bacterium]|nr:hypothetical protein [Hyphomicrobiales bacterium]
MDYFLRFAPGVYGEPALLGVAWHLFWWFLGAGLAFALVHALSVPLLHRRQARLAQANRPFRPGEVSHDHP